MADFVLPMMSYIVTIGTDSPQILPKHEVEGIKEQLLKRAGADIKSS